MLRSKAIKLIVKVSAMAQLCHPDKYRRRMRMLARSLVWAKHSYAWFSRIKQCPLLFELTHHDKRLIEKLHRPYLNRNNNVAERHLLLINHYELLQKHFNAHQIRRIYFGQGILLASSNTRTGASYELWLRDAGGNDKEGELGLYWVDSQTHVTLAQLSFSLVMKDELPHLYIGGLQGTFDPQARDWIRKATRQCNGLRPKRAVMEGLFSLAKLIDAKGILAVSDSHHVNQSIRIQRTVHASYDKFWKEFDAVKNDRGDFHLPLIAKQRCLSQIESKKRSEYQRRHERLDNIFAETLANLQTCV